MSAILESLKGLFTGVRPHKVHVDNVVFRLHYKVTAILLIVFGVLVTERQYIGDPIDCIQTEKNADKIVDAFCWIHGTYTNLEISKKDDLSYTKELTQEDDVKYITNVLKTNDYSNPKLEREFFNYKPGPVESRTFHKWYQWVWCFLFFQACLFYFPHWLWKTWEGGRMKTFVANLNLYILSEEDKRKYMQPLCDYFCDTEKGKWSIFCWTPKGNHTIYAMKYFFCELLNFVNICCQLYFLDTFFNNGLSKYGLSLWRVTDARPYARNDYMTRIFPIVTMCELPIIGYGGSITGHQAVCILPINVLNEKIVLILWAWYMVVVVATSLGVCYRILTIFPCIAIRKWLILRLNHSMSDRAVDTLCRQVDFGDWYFLYLLGKNMNPVYYAELIQALANRFEGHPPGTPRTMEPWSNESSLRKGSFIGV